jgi:hypothetical protein
MSCFSNINIVVVNIAVVAVHTDIAIIPHVEVFAMASAAI